LVKAGPRIDPARVDVPLCNGLWGDTPAVERRELVPIHCVRGRTKVDLTKVRYNQVQYNRIK
jgi:hypothetical protein